MEDRMRPVHEVESEASTSVSTPDLLTVFRRRWGTMVVTGLIVIGITVAYAIMQPRIYEASTWMLVTSTEKAKDAEAVLARTDPWQSLQSDIAMHERLLKRAEIAQSVKEALDLQLPVGRLIQQLSVSKVTGASSNLLSINFRSQDPQQAANVTNEWSETYKQSSRERATSSTAAAIKFVESQIDTVESDLRDLEKQMADLEQEYLEKGVNIGRGGDGQRFTDIISQIAQNRVEIQATQAHIKRTQQNIEEEPPEIQEVEEEPSLEAQAIQEQLSQLHIELQKKLQNYYTDSPEVKALKDQIQRLEERLKDSPEMTRAGVNTAPNPVYTRAENKLIELQGKLDALRARQSALQERLAKQEQFQRLAPTGTIKYNELRRKAEGLQGVHSTLLSRLYELQLQKAMAVPPVQIVREAETPHSPVSPQYQTIFGIGFVAALLLAALAVVVVDQIDDTFLNPEEIREVLQARLVGAIPDFPREEEEAFELQVGHPEASERTAFANAIRMLSSTVRIEMSQQDDSSLMITSTDRAEGKTLIAANLAAALAGTGERVLLVDTDLHRPRLHGLFDIEQQPGLSDFLVDDKPLDELAQPTSVENLKVLPSGPLPPSPVDILSSQSGVERLEELSNTAEYVIFDTPPAGFLADGIVIGHSTDRTLFVVGKQARRGAARETVANLREVGISLIGLCANRVKPLGGSYYYDYYYDYYSDDEE